MLRTHPSGEVEDSVAIQGEPSNAFPGPDEPFASQDRAVGVLFYQTKQGFFLPYHSLQSMDFTATRIALEFPQETVVITGRGLHGLALGIARQSIARIVEQGDRGSTAATSIVRIRRIPKGDEVAADLAPDSP